MRPYGIPSDVQGFITWQPDGLKYPIVGYYDFMWKEQNFIVDLKSTERMPSNIKVGHARQVSLYSMHNNSEGFLCYVTPKKINMMKLENRAEHRQALYQLAKRVENFLALGDDPEFFVSITAPDLDSFYWGDPAARELAFKYWRI